MRNLPLTFDCMYCSQKKGEDFARFCGLLRIYELYLASAVQSERRFLNWRLLAYYLDVYEHPCRLAAWWLQACVRM